MAYAIPMTLRHILALIVGIILLMCGVFLVGYIATEIFVFSLLLFFGLDENSEWGFSWMYMLIPTLGVLWLWWRIRTPTLMVSLGHFRSIPYRFEPSAQTLVNSKQD